jgi:peptidoglycan/LPS O-acetylase OafA/YrhL
MSIGYRADIDGLRAVAILPVVLFHYGVPGFSGGFVGVDVFFVISGFLITSLILSELRAGKFSIVNFYERRVRRIFPALFFMLLAATVAGYVLLFPYAFRLYGESAVATSLFVSNFKFWDQAGYFDLSASEKPLLHTWSLAVEEQFYLVFPPILMAVARWGRGRYLAAIIPLLVLSLAVSIWQTYAAPTAAFYLLPSRLWELMLGAALAAQPMAMTTPLERKLLAYGGIGAIVMAVLQYSNTTPFPGLAALVPCLGAALVIAMGTDGTTPVNRFLSSPIAVFTGKISYSLYLWHWPILIYARYAMGRDPDAFEAAALIVASLAIASFSWRFVEQPFRRRTALPKRGSLFAGAGAAMLTAVLAGLAIGPWLRGAPQRYDAQTRAILAVEDGRNPIVCPGAAPMEKPTDPPCALGHSADGTYSFLLWGDSHADAMSQSLAAAADDAGQMGLKAGHDACPPLLGVRNIGAAQCNDTERRNEDILAIIRKYDVKTVILAARWAVYARGLFVKLEEDPKILLNDAESREVSFAEDARVFKRALFRTVETLRKDGRRVVIVGPWPEPGLRVPQLLAKARLFGTTTDFGPTRDEFLARQSAVFDAFRQFEGDEGVKILPTHEELCASGHCKVEEDGQPLYWDDDHLSRLGALRLKPVFARIFH